MAIGDYVIRSGIGDYVIRDYVPACTKKQLERPGFEAHRNQTRRNIPLGKN